VTLKVLIADDEPLASERLRFLLSSDQEVEIAAECRNGREVIAALKEAKIDVIFLDIEMPGRGGFEVIEQIGARHMPVTVFVTAHNEYAVQAFEVNALDYLTTPIEPERLRATLVRVKEQISSHLALATHDRLSSILQGLENGMAPSKDYPKRLLVHNGAKDSFVNVNEIEWIEAADYYSCLHVGPRSFMLREPIKLLAATLDPERFVRIHRSIIVNLDHVREIFREGKSEGSVVLNNGHRLKMSKAGWQSLLAISRK
jgi:two-component system LytT family response regulator